MISFDKLLKSSMKNCFISFLNFKKTIFISELYVGKSLRFERFVNIKILFKLIPEKYRKEKLFFLANFPIKISKGL